MNGISALLLIPILTITVVLSLSISNANAVVVNHTNFSIQVPNGWVYRENYPIENNIVLTPNEFADILITDNVSALLDSLHSKIIVELAPDVNFPIKNAPPETYAKNKLEKFVLPFTNRSENATIGGEKAVKVYINGTEFPKIMFSPKLNASINADAFNPKSINYFVMHHDQPYYLDYIAFGIYNYQKYLPQFEQIVKSFKFVD